MNFKPLYLSTIWMVTSASLDAQLPSAIRFTDTVSCTQVEDQGQSPTCWAFAGTSLFETDLLQTKGKRFDFSEMFIARYAYIDKAKQFLATGGKTYYEGGGQYRDILRVVKKSGIMPEGLYMGFAGDAKPHNHTKLNTSMQQYVRQLLLKEKKTLTDIDIRNLNDTLDKYLGKVPATFSYAEKVYTPVSFRKAIGLNPDDYIDLVSFADQPLHKKFILNDKYNWAYDSLYNISLDEMLMVVDTALHKGYGVAWEGDVTDPGFQYIIGYASLDYTAVNIDSLRLANYASEKTERDHGMQITGAGRDSTGQKWYSIKNSWGQTNLKQGYIYMNENYFRMQTVILLVNKNGLPDALRKKMRL